MTVTVVLTNPSSDPSVENWRAKVEAVVNGVLKGIFETWWPVDWKRWQDIRLDMMVYGSARSPFGEPGTPPILWRPVKAGQARVDEGRRVVRSLDEFLVARDELEEGIGPKYTVVDALVKSIRLMRREGRPVIDIGRRAGKSDLVRRMFETLAAVDVVSAMPAPQHPPRPSRVPEQLQHSFKRRR